MQHLGRADRPGRGAHRADVHPAEWHNPETAAPDRGLVLYLPGGGDPGRLPPASDPTGRHRRRSDRGSGHDAWLVVVEGRRGTGAR